MSFITGLRGDPASPKQEEGSMNRHQQILTAAAAALPEHLDLGVWYEDVATWVVCRACGTTWYCITYIDPHTYAYHYQFKIAFVPLGAVCPQTSN
jgi:hypothetical protein